MTTRDDIKTAETYISAMYDAYQVALRASKSGRKDPVVAAIEAEFDKAMDNLNRLKAGYNSMDEILERIAADPYAEYMVRPAGNGFGIYVMTGDCRADCLVKGLSRDHAYDILRAGRDMGRASA